MTTKKFSFLLFFSSVTLSIIMHNAEFNSVVAIPDTLSALLFFIVLDYI